MLERETQVSLIKNEIEHIRYFDHLAISLQNILGSIEYEPQVPCQNYEIYSMILDDLGIPQDKDLPFPGRDPYWDLYLDTWSDPNWEKNKNKIVNKLIDDIIKISGKKKNEKKTRIRK